MSTQTAPNVLSYTRVIEDTGTTFVLYKSYPGDTAPRISMQAAGGAAIDCGAVEEPERFGPYGTPEEFEAWARNFFDH